MRVCLKPMVGGPCDQRAGSRIGVLFNRALAAVRGSQRLSCAARRKECPNERFVM